MRLRSGKTLVDITRPKNTPLPQNNALDNEEQPFEYTVSGACTSTTIGAATLFVTQMSDSTTLLKVMVPPPQVTSIPTTLRVTQGIIGDHRPSFLPSFTLRLSSREYPYGMPTAMMANLQTNASRYADNTMTVASPLNPYLASRSSISNPIRMAQP